MALNRLDVSTIVVDSLFVNTYASFPAAFVTNAMVQAGADISASKLESCHRLNYGQNGGAVSAEAQLGIVRGTAGSILSFEVNNVTACAGASTVSVDLYKNGTSILSSPVTLNSSSTAYTPTAGTISSASIADGDVLTAVVTPAQDGTSALATGVGVSVDLIEDYAS